MDALKRRLVGTSLGRAVMRGREVLNFLRVSRHPSLGAVLAQDSCTDRLLARLTRPGRTFVDVGAHIGSVFSEVKHRDPSVLVVAIEAVPEKVEALAQRFPDVTFHCCAVGESDGEVSFFVDTRRSGYSSMARRLGASEGESTTKEIRVPLRPLDALLAEVKNVDVVKLDVEGAELGVLRGGVNVVKRHRPVIVFESCAGSGAPHGYSEAGLFDWFEAHEFGIFVPNRVAHEGRPLSREGFEDSHCFPRRTTNYFAIPKERREGVRHRAHEVLA